MLKITTLAPFALALLGACAAATQANKITVQAGAAYPYAVKSTMEVTQSMAGQEMTVTTATNGSGNLKAENVSGDRIDWSYDTEEMRLTFDNTMMPGMAKDTTMEIPTQRFSTDRFGKLISMDIPEGNEELAQVLEALMGQRQGPQWFPPAQLAGRKPGESWEEKTSDTVDNPVLGMKLRMTATTRYTFEGVVDTLGAQASRVSVRTTGMELQGELLAEGMTMAIDGDGLATGVSYFSRGDGLLLTSSTETQRNMRISVAEEGEMVIPVTQRMRSTVVRK